MKKTLFGRRLSSGFRIDYDMMSMDGCAPILMVKADVDKSIAGFFGGAQGEGTFWNIMESWTGFYPKNRRVLAFYLELPWM